MGCKAYDDIMVPVALRNIIFHVDGQLIMWRVCILRKLSCWMFGKLIDVEEDTKIIIQDNYFKGYNYG